MTWNDMEYQAIKILLIWKFPKMGIPPKTMGFNTKMVQ
jgi:hypothetical protein